MISPNRRRALRTSLPQAFTQSLLTGVFPLLNDSGYDQNGLTVIRYGMEQSEVSSLHIVIYGMR